MLEKVASRVRSLELLTSQLRLANTLFLLFLFASILGGCFSFQDINLFNNLTLKYVYIQMFVGGTVKSFLLMLPQSSGNSYWPDMVLLFSK